MIETDRQPCRECGRLTLPATLRATGGLCRKCRPGVRPLMEQKADQQRSGGANAERGLAFKDEVYYHIRPPLTEECWSRIADADQLVIYSLEEKPPPPRIPRRSDRQGDIKAPRLHGYPILSQVDIVDPRTIGKVYSSLRRGLKERLLACDVLSRITGLVLLAVK